MATPNKNPTEPIDIIKKRDRDPCTGSFFPSYREFDDFQRAYAGRSRSVRTFESASDVMGSVPSDTENQYNASPPPEPLQTQYLRIQFCVWPRHWQKAAPEDHKVKLTGVIFLFEKETYESLEVRQLIKH
jgi:hypothetical protein